jgi:hypothetical protein
LTREAGSIGNVASVQKAFYPPIVGIVGQPHGITEGLGVIRPSGGANAGAGCWPTSEKHIPSGSDRVRVGLFTTVNLDCCAHGLDLHGRWTYALATLKGSDMKAPSLLLPRELCRYFLLIGLWLTFVPLGMVSQQQQNSSPQKVPMDASEGLSVPGLEPQPKYKIPDFFTSITIVNYLKQNIRVTVESDKYVFFAGEIPALSGCSSSGFPSVIVDLPATEYKVTVTVASGFLPNSATVQGVSAKYYYVLVGENLFNRECGWGAGAGAAAANANALPKTATSIGQQIDHIAHGQHQELPQPTTTSTTQGQNSGWTVENATGYLMNLYLSGPTEMHYKISNGGSINIDLPPGMYRIAVDVSDTSVKPFYGVKQLDVNARWIYHFYIAPQ